MSEINYTIPYTKTHLMTINIDEEVYNKWTWLIDKAISFGIEFIVISSVLWYLFQPYLTTEKAQIIYVLARWFGIKSGFSFIFFDTIMKNVRSNNSSCCAEEVEK